MSKENENKDLFAENLPELPEDDAEDFDWEETAKNLFKFANEARGVAKRNLKDKTKVEEELEKLSKENSDNKKPADSSEENQGFNHGELAYLEAKNVGEEHHERLFKIKEESGLELKELLSRDWVKSEIKEMDAKKEVQKATPQGTKPSSTSDKKSVEYWLAKEEYPKDDPELKRKVHEARSKQEKRSNKFTKKPIV